MRTLILVASALVVGLAFPVVAGSELAGPTVLVQQPQLALDVEASVGEAMGDLFAEQLERSRVFASLVTTRDVVDMLKLEQSKQMLGCDDQGQSCLAEIAGALGASHLALLDVRKLAGAHVLTARLIELGSARVLFRQSRTLTTLDGAQPVIAELAQKLAAGVARNLAEAEVASAALRARAETGAQKRAEAGALLAGAQRGEQEREAVRLARLMEESPDMVLVPAGEFFFGCNTQVDAECLENEKPGRRIEERPFKIDRHEVTLAAYESCVESGTCSTAEHDGFGCVWGAWFSGERPINCVDWTQARTFCEWKRKRLPTAREWEKAARGNDGRRFPWGNAVAATPPAQLAPEADSPSVVGSHPQGASPYGALDMAGNVAEWTDSTYDEKRYEYRGGGFLSALRFARTSDRHRAEARTKKSDLGFRCAL